MKSFLKFWFNGVCYDNQLIFPSAADNRILYVDIQTGQITFGEELVCVCNEQSKEIPFYYTGAVYIGSKKILFTSRNQKYFLQFDLGAKEQRLVETDLPDVLKTGEQYWQDYIYQNNLFLFPFYAGHILKFDLRTMKADANEKIIENINLLAGKNEAPYFGAKVKCESENIVLLVGWSDNFMIQIDLKTMDYHVVLLKNEGQEKGFRDIAVYGNYIYTVNHKFHVFQYKRDTFEAVKRINILRECAVVKRTDTGLCFIPAFEEEYAVCGPDGRVASRMSYPPELTFLPEDENGRVNNLVAETDEYYLIARIYGNAIQKIEKNTGNISFIPLKYDESVRDYLYNQYERGSEGRNIPNANGLKVCAKLQDLITDLCYRNRECTGTDSVGEVIYRTLK